ncbi:hypothetical protein [Ensifer adhaerens]|uniref:hypothetical protein n=1 Tax=Ensifer adhaerens TaxID=106592 RepID=UPI000DC333A7|nr:hypothetical protein [Ensifer adhaerens]RAS08317.1 hypothetical protein DEU52_11849 [Ensifer adhaerens]
MASAYAVAPIKAAQVERAYCLIGAVGYDIDIDRWRQICAAILARKHLSPFIEEIAAVEDALGYIRGVAILRVRHHERMGRYLSVPVFVTASAADARGVCGALLGYLNEVALDRRCGAIHIARLSPDRWPATDGAEDGIIIPLR